MSTEILTGNPFFPSGSKFGDVSPSSEVSFSVLETWFSSYNRPPASAAPIVASTITLEAIQNYLLHTTGLPFDASGNQDVFLGPFEDTQFDAVVDVETSDESMQDLKLTDLDSFSENDCSGSDLSDDDMTFLQLEEIPDSPLLSDDELDFSNDSGIEAEMEEAHDGTEEKEEKENKSKNCDDKKSSEDVKEEGSSSTDRQSEPTCAQTVKKETPETKSKGNEVEQKTEEKDKDDDLPTFHCQYLWEFLHHLLSEKHHQYIVWKNQSKGVFRLIDHNGVAKLWGKHKKRKNMTYEKLSRALRYYYSKNILRKVPGQRLTYKFVRNLNGKKYPL